MAKPSIGGERTPWARADRAPAASGIVARGAKLGWVFTRRHRLDDGSLYLMPQIIGYARLRGASPAAPSRRRIERTAVAWSSPPSSCRTSRRWRRRSSTTPPLTAQAFARSSIA
jgi:hypothetical protein